MMATPLHKYFKRPVNNSIPPFKQFHYLNKMPAAQLNELLVFTEEFHLAHRLFQLRGMSSLLLTHLSTAHYSEIILEKSPASLIHYKIGTKPARWEEATKPKTDIPFASVYGSFKTLAIKPQSLEFIILPMVSENDVDLASVLPEISQALQNGGHVMISVVHPFLEWMLTNQNPTSNLRSHTSYQNYFHSLKKNHLYLEDCFEALVDTSNRPFFISDDQGERFYQEFKGLPLILFLKAVKFTKTKHEQN